MHRHCCDVTGHEYQCSDDCECFCGLPMEQGDHSDCPVQLRACPEHQGKTACPISEVGSDAVASDFSILSPERQRAVPHCECGCAAADRSKMVGWCLWCDHGYVHYSRVIESRHFANNCPGAPHELKEAERAMLAKPN